MDNIENNILKILNEDKEVIEEITLNDIISAGVDTIGDYTKIKIENFFNNKIVKSILTKLITELIISNPLILKEITSNVLDNIKINVEKK